MNLDVDHLQRQIPYYLTAEDQQVLIRELKAISSGGSSDYFLSSYRDSFAGNILQGDGWRGFQLFSFELGTLQNVRGLVLSNSCDIDSENPRDIPSRIIFAPLVKLATYKSLLEKSDIETSKISSKIASIKSQKTTNIFFLPAGKTLSEDYVVRFDEIFSMPATMHANSKIKEKLFTLSNAGFYMLVLKLSVHFCRLQENIERKPTTSMS